MKVPILIVVLAIATITNAGPASKQRDPPRERVGGQIIGGEDALPGDRPFQVSIQDLEYGEPGYHLCGGTIYSTDTIITSATCVYGEKPNQLQIVAGEYNLHIEEGNEQIIQVDQIIPHPEYSPIDFSNDIALLRLRSHLSFTETVKSVFIPPSNFVASGDCTISGWGSSHINDDNLSDTLQKVTIPIVSAADCDYFLNEIGYGSLSNVFCAGYQESDKNACIGDDGGPLTCIHEGHLYLAGVLSFDNGCHFDHYPGVYVEIEHYRQWIENNN